MSKSKQSCELTVYKKLAECFSNVLLLFYTPLGNIWKLKLFVHSPQDWLRSFFSHVSLSETLKDTSL